MARGIPTPRVGSLLKRGRSIATRGAPKAAIGTANADHSRNGDPAVVAQIQNASLLGKAIRGAKSRSRSTGLKP